MIRQDQMISPVNVRILQDSDLPQAQRTPQPSFNDVLYMYRQTGCLDGIPVQQDAQKLLVQSQQQLRSALMLHAKVYTYLEWLTPDAKQQLERYQQILQAAAQGSAQIMQQTKQYSESKGAFLVFVKYRCMQYTLHPRWQHLKDNNEV